MEIKKSNIDFKVPYYIFEEILEYIELTEKGKCKCCKWSNIVGLMRLAKASGRLTEEQCEVLEKQYNCE